MRALVAASRRRRETGDGGFTLLEVMVAIILLGIVSAGIIPLLVGTLQAANSAKLNTQAKNLVQAQVERMRNLPYHVAQSAGPYIDLLDIYYHDLGGGTDSKCGTSSYSAGTYTCVNPVGLSQSGYTITVATQFLDKDRNVVTPPNGYDSQSNSGLDVPPANTVGVTVTATWNNRGKTKSYSSYTEISNAPTGLPQTVAKVRDDSLVLSTAKDDSASPVLLKWEGGVVNADTSLSTGATANAQVQGALTTYSSGYSSTSQASGTLIAPADQNSFTTVIGTPTSGQGCTVDYVACFNNTQVSNVTGKASNGLPLVASAASPATATLMRNGSYGFWFSNLPVGSVQNRLTALQVLTQVPSDPSYPPTTSNPTQLVREVQGSPSNGYTAACEQAGTANSNIDYLTSTGYVTTTGGTSHSVTSCATAASRRIDIMPTTFAPNGVVQVTLNWASMSCTAAAGAAGTTATVTPNYSATVSYWSPASNSYVPITVTNTQTSDPLSASLLTVGPGGVQVGSDQTGNPLYLGQYVKAWSSGVFNGGSQAGGTIARGDLSVVNLTTVPTRDSDSTGQSSINLTAGQLSCLAEDNR